MGLIVVRKMPKDEEPAYFCRVCEMRGERTVFLKDEQRAYQAHVIACSNAHEEDLRALSLRRRLPAAFDPEFEGHDREWGQWLRTHRREIEEGRKNMRTSLDGL